MKYYTRHGNILKLITLFTHMVNDYFEYSYTYQLYHLLSIRVDYMKVEGFASYMLQVIISHVLQPVLSHHRHLPSCR